MVEQWTFNPWVMGSSPIKPITDGSTIRPWNEILSRKGTNHDLEIVLFRSTMHSSCVWDVAKWQGKGLWSLDRRFDSFHPNFLCQWVSKKMDGSIFPNDGIILLERSFFLFECSIRLSVRTLPFHGEKTGSIPVWCDFTKKEKQRIVPILSFFFLFFET